MTALQSAEQLARIVSQSSRFTTGHCTCNEVSQVLTFHTETLFKARRVATIVILSVHLSVRPPVHHSHTTCQNAKSISSLFRTYLSYHWIFFIPNILTKWPLLVTVNNFQVISSTRNLSGTNIDQWPPSTYLTMKRSQTRAVIFFSCW